MPTVKDSYETDFFAWTRETAEKIRKGDFSTIDLEALAEEVEDLGRHDRREIRSRIKQILIHLLKWRFQPGYRRDFGESSWRTSIQNQRGELLDVLEESPSLRRFLPDSIAEAYPKAVAGAAKESGLPAWTFPGESPWTLEQILDEDFFPGD